MLLLLRLLVAMGAAPPSPSRRVECQEALHGLMGALVLCVTAPFLGVCLLWLFLQFKVPAWTAEAVKFSVILGVWEW